MPNQRLRILGGSSHPRLAEELAGELGAELVPVEIDAFADGETRVHIGGPVRNGPAFLVQPTCPPVNDNLMKAALLADAARAAGVSWLGAIVPYFGYARQERRAADGQPRSAQVAIRLLEAVGIDHLVTLDLHAPGLESALRVPTLDLQPDPVLLPLIRSWDLDRPTIVSPDAGALGRAQQYAIVLKAELAAIAKARPEPDRPKPLKVLGEVRGRACLLVDDIASTGSTLCTAAEALLSAGARTVHALFTHPVMAPRALDRLAGSPIERLATTDSIPPPEHPRIETVQVAPVLAEAVRELPP